MNNLENIEAIAGKEFDIFQKENPIVPKSDIRPFNLGFVKGVRYGRKGMYSEKEVKQMCDRYHNQMCLLGNVKAQEWFEENKKK